MSTRLDAFREAFNKQGLDAFLVSNFYNILYLTGFKTLTDSEREAWFLVTKKDVYLFTDGRYRASNDILRLLTPERRLIHHLQEIVGEEGIKSLGIEGEDLRFSEYEAFKNNLKNTKIVPKERLLLRQRETKDSDEIQKIKEACDVIDRCLKELRPLIKVGIGEKEIAAKIEFWLKNKGWNKAFDPIVAVDENSAIPHYDTRHGNDAKIKNCSIILIDAGASVKDYNSDITRMFFVGRPENQVVNTYTQLLKTQKDAVKRLGKERIYKNIDSFCRKELVATGFPNFPHSTGHGIGLEVHEYPKVSSLSEDKIKPGQVVTIEPGIYFEGKWGIRLEDTVLIKDSGVEPLTRSPFSSP